jgi:hypothetical protein
MPDAYSAGVLKFKRDSEMALEASGLPYTHHPNISATLSLIIWFLLFVLLRRAQV